MQNRVRFIIEGLVILAVVALYGLYFMKGKESIAYVDSAKLMNGYQAMIDARKDYQKKATSWQANVDTLVAEVQTAIKKHEREVASMSVKERELSEEVLRGKQRQLNEYQQAMQAKSQEEDRKMSQTVIDQANSFLERYGKNHSYRIIFAATPSGNIVYAQEGMDITEEVLKALNQEYGKAKQ